MTKNKNSPRFLALYFIFLVFFLFISSKIIYLQVFKRNFFQNLANNQYYRLVKLEGKRGNILDRQGRILATDINCYSVFADPALVEDPQQVSSYLSEYLDLSSQEILQKLKRKNRFVWIKRKITWEQKEHIKSLKFKGIGFLGEKKRFYPEKELALSLLGIVDIDNKGLEGIELFYNTYLNGKQGWARILQDSASRRVLVSSEIINPQRGADIVLTIDAQIQYWTRNCLQEAVDKFDAVKGGAVVMDAESGKILALVNCLGSESKEAQSGKRYVKNGVVCDMFEPGSVFKVVTLIASIDRNLFSNDDYIFCEKGAMKIPGTVLHDWRPYGDLKFKEVFMKSSNIGVAKIASRLEPAVLSKYIRKLGFGEKSGIDFPGETGGSFKKSSSWSKTSRYIIPIGQEIGVNLIQLVRVFAVVANGGYLVEPHLVEEICSWGFCKALGHQKKQVISADVAGRAKDILIEVVEEGTGRMAKVENLTIGGKTGTAQKYDPGIGRYSSSKYRATFIGFVASADPPVVIGISVDEPRKSHFGGVVAAPVVREIAKKIVPYLHYQEIGFSEARK